MTIPEYDICDCGCRGTHSDCNPTPVAGPCNGPCDVGAVATCPECVGDYRARIASMEQEIKERKAAYEDLKKLYLSLALNVPDGKVALAELTTQRDSYERALKVIHVWAGTPGFQLPENVRQFTLNVRQITSKALGAKP